MSAPPREFTYHRRSGLAALLYTVAALAVVEMTAVDFVLRAHHRTAANVLLAAGVVSALWLFRFARAVQSRPIVVHGDTLLVRLGLLWRADVALSNVVSAEFGRVKVPAKRTPGLLRIGTQPNALLTLREPVVAHGPYGRMKTVTQIGLTLDDVKGFEQAVRGGA